MAEQIHIGFGIDKNFGRFAGITITSLAHNNIANELIIHIVYDEILPEDMERLLRTEQLYRNLTLHFYQITSTEGMTFVVPPGHITQAMYYRYLFADLLPPTVTRLISIWTPTSSARAAFCRCGRPTCRVRCWELYAITAKTAAAGASGSKTAAISIPACF